MLSPIGKQFPVSSSNLLFSGQLQTLKLLSNYPGLLHLVQLFPFQYYELIQLPADENTIS
jgi:hypothetical protein